ncbi:MAG: acyl-CoA dehydrogenase family protein [Actinomycetes bacterium]
MDFSLAEEQQAVRDLALQIMTEQAPPEHLKALEAADDAAGTFDAALWSALAEAGLLGIALPEDVGGADLDFVALCQIVEVAGLTAAYVPVVETLVSAADTINRFGTDDQKAAWLPQIASGELIATAATAELVGDVVVPGLDAPATIARSTGDGFTLTGVKACVPSGLRASLLLIPASIEGGGVGVFLVDASSVTTEAQEGPARREALVTLDSATVSADRLLGGSGADGAAIIASMVLRTTAALCALEAGVVTSAVKLGAEYTSEREQFEKKIATFQAVGQRMADAYVDAEAIRLTASQAVWRISEGEEALDAVAIAKFWAAEGGQRVVHAATHVHGGVGVDRDYPLHRFFLLTRQIELTLGGATQSLLALGARAAASA